MLPHALPPAAGSSGAAPVHVDRTGGPVQPLGLPPLSPGTGDATSQVPRRALLRPLCMCSGHAALLLADRLLASHPPPGGLPCVWVPLGTLEPARSPAQPAGLSVCTRRP